MRFERKYKIESLDVSLVEQMIQLHPANFQKIFPDRQVNNIYFDTLDFATFQDNVVGIADRKKFRIRWYGEFFQKIEKPVFEIKIKQNLLGDKMVQPFDSFHLKDFKNASPQNPLLQKIQTLSKSAAPLQPVLLNAYHRSYFGTPDRKFRITIDRKMRFDSFLNNLFFDGYMLEDQGVVLEIKYEQSLDNQTDFITQHFPFRLTKNSKYVTGVQMIVG